VRQSCAPPPAGTSGGLPIFDTPLRLSEFVATLALAQDNAFGQPLESQLRSCLLATSICDAAGFDEEVRDTAYWVALLRYVGCTGHAHEVATVFGDEIAIRAATLTHDAANPAEVMQDVMKFATAGRTPEEQEAIVKLIKETAKEWAVYNFTSGCEVADMLLERLDFGPDVREAIRFTFERWNGNGYPDHAAGEAIPLAMRVVHLSHDMEAIGRLFSPDRAVEAARDRRDRTYDPALADIFVEHGKAWLEQLAETDPWDAVLALEPEPHRVLSGEQLDDALTVAADFIDLKSPFMGGHSRRCAELAAGAARVLGLPEDGVTSVRRAALVHDFGTTVVPNSIWDKPGPLTRTEFDRVELHPLLTEQMLRRSPALAVLNPVASAHHEKCDGSGYHKRVQADADDLGADDRASGPSAVLARGRGQRAARARVEGRARAAREPRGAGGSGARRATRALAQAGATSGRPHQTRSRGAAARGQGADNGPDRRPARHLTQDRRPPHPAHLRQDRHLDAGRRRAVGYAAFSRAVTW
jgi:HD-GYP domain-containing protein (c-di-GMP phosphodiesterase class II)